GIVVTRVRLAPVTLCVIPRHAFFFVSGAPEGGTPRLSTIYYIAVVSALFACVDFYFQFPAPAGYGPQFVWLDSGVFRRAQGFFYEASTLGNFCAFFLVMIAVALGDRKSTRLNSSHLGISYAVFCLKKKKRHHIYS